MGIYLHRFLKYDASPINNYLHFKYGELEGYCGNIYLKFALSGILSLYIIPFST